MSEWQNAMSEIKRREEALEQAYAIEYEKFYNAIMPALEQMNKNNGEKNEHR